MCSSDLEAQPMDHVFNFKEAKVIHKEKDQKRRRFLEAIEITKKHNTANLCSGQQVDLNWLPTVKISS